MKIKILIAAALWLLCAALAEAQNVHPKLEHQLSWSDNSDNEAGFRVEQCLGAGCTVAGASFVKIGVQTAPNVTTYIDVILNDPGNRTICYRVRAFNDAGESAPSNVACVTTAAVLQPPNAPGGLKATQITKTTIRLEWPDTPNEEKYEVARNSQIVGETMSGITSYTDSGLRRNTWYTYRARGWNQAGYSPWSEALKTKTLR